MHALPGYRQSGNRSPRYMVRPRSNCCGVRVSCLPAGDQGAQALPSMCGLLSWLARHPYLEIGAGEL